MNTPSVTFHPNLKYRVTFIPPFSGGVAVLIDTYEIEFMKKDGVTFAPIAECDGS